MTCRNVATQRDFYSVDNVEKVEGSFGGEERRRRKRKDTTKYEGKITLCLRGSSPRASVPSTPLLRTSSLIPSLARISFLQVKEKKNLFSSL